MSKGEMRLKLLSKRKDMPLSYVKAQSKLINDKIIQMDCFKQDNLTVGLYCPVNNEVDIMPLWRFFLEKKFTCAFPKVISENTMQFYAMDEGDSWAAGPFGNPEPQSKDLVRPEAFDVMLVPLVAFDSNLNRLGYGKGYYDNYLKYTDCLKVGIAFSWQMVTKIDCSNIDVQLDIIID